MPAAEEEDMPEAEEEQTAMICPGQQVCCCGGRSSGKYGVILKWLRKKMRFLVRLYPNSAGVRSKVRDIHIREAAALLICNLKSRREAMTSTPFAFELKPTNVRRSIVAFCGAGAVRL